MCRTTRGVVLVLRRVQVPLFNMKSFIGRRLSSIFQSLGESLGKYPSKYLIASVLFALVQLLGLIRFHHLQDFNELFNTKTGRSAKDMEFIKTKFPLNDSQPLDMERSTEHIRNGMVIVVAKDGGSVFRKNVSEEILLLENDIYNITVEWKGKKWNFSSVCSPWWYGDCLVNSASVILRRLDDFNAGIFRPSYPIDWNSYKEGITAMNLGGVQLDKRQKILSAKAIRLFFQLEYRGSENFEISHLWEEKFVDEMDRRSYKDVDFCILTGLSISIELTRTALSGAPIGTLSVVAIFLFAILTSLTSDPVKSKPWLGLAGGTSAMLGLVSSFGFLFMLGMPYIDIVLSVPYIMLGIGIDDSFVLVAAWRRTKSKDSVPKRMGEAYSESAVSVTITSFTNLLSFLVAMAAPYKQIRIYAVYCSMSVLFCYFYQIIFFGACMALSGYREEKNLHSLTFRKVSPKNGQSCGKMSKEKNGYQVPENEKVYSTRASKFLRDRFSNILIHKYSRIIIFLVFVLYLTVAGIGCSRVVDGPEYRNGFRYQSSGWKCMDWNYRYFGDYMYRIQVVVNEELDYSDPIIQSKIEELAKTYEDTSFCEGSTMTKHWLRSYTSFLNSTDIGTRIILSGFNTSNSQEFNYVLRNIFLKIPIYKEFSSDVVFNSNFTRITQSRFFIQLKNIEDSAGEKKILEDLYYIADSCEYKTIVYNPGFLVIEQSMFTKSVTTQTVLCTAAIMILVFLIMVPNFRCALAVTFCLCSIETGVVGYMSFWNINLDPLSMMCLIMSVGFSVDFASHVTYSYATCNECGAEGRIRYSMFSAGVPVLQGAGSTILGSFFLIFTSSNSFVVIFKVIFLTMVLATFHSLFLLPILLSLITSFPIEDETNYQPTVGEEELKLNSTDKAKKNDFSFKGLSNNETTILHPPS